VVPIRWDAVDEDDGFYSFDIQVSYDGGRTWKVLVEHLPPDAREFDWALPESDGIEDVRVRVIARDMHFQNSTTDPEIAFSVTAGSGCYPDCDGDGALSIDDFVCYQTYFAFGDGYADCDGNGTLSIDDFICYQTFFAIGCP
jgi:hypothetical protein